MATRKKAVARYHHGSLRQALVDAAVGLLEEQGVAAWTLREVARRSGVSHTAPYHHFADKDRLLMAVALEGFHGLSAKMRGASAGLDDPLERLRALSIAYVTHAIAHRGHFLVMHRAETLAPSLEARLEREALLAAAQESLGLVVRAVVDAQRAGVVPDSDPVDVAVVFWSTVYGLATLWVMGPLREGPFGGKSVAARTALAADLLIRGLAK